MKGVLVVKNYDLIPSDPLTQQILIDVLTAMYKYKNAAAASEFTRPDAATAGMEPAKADPTAKTTTDTVSGQSDDDESGS